MPFYIEKKNIFICDNCGRKAEFTLANNRNVRKYGWAISKDYRSCYCPNCKDLYTSVGCQGLPTYCRKAHTNESI